jgi:hypothetical protein
MFCVYRTQCINKGHIIKCYDAEIGELAKEVRSYYAVYIEGAWGQSATDKFWN